MLTNRSEKNNNLLPVLTSNNIAISKDVEVNSLSFSIKKALEFI